MILPPIAVAGERLYHALLDAEHIVGVVLVEFPESVAVLPTSSAEVRNIQGRTLRLCTGCRNKISRMTTRNTISQFTQNVE